MTVIIAVRGRSIQYLFTRPLVPVIGNGVTLRRAYRHPFTGRFQLLAIGIPLTAILLRGRPTARKNSTGDWITRYAKGTTTERMVPAGNKLRMTMHTSPALSVNSACAELPSQSLIPLG